MIFDFFTGEAIPLTATDIFESCVLMQTENMGLILSIFAILYMKDDSKCGAIKTVLSTGYTRLQYLSVKTFLICMPYVLLMLLELISTLVAILVIKGTLAGLNPAVFGMFFMNMLVNVMLALFAIFIASLFKSTGSAVAILFVLPIVGGLVLAILDVLFYFAPLFRFSSFWLLNLDIETLDTVVAYDVIVSIVSSLIYIATFCLGNWLLHRRREY